MIGLGIGLLAVSSRADVPTDNPQRGWLDQAVQRSVSAFFQNGCHVGLSLATTDGRGARFYDYGATARVGGRLPSRKSVYEIASITKTFTGALAARAMVEGRMALDADFRSYLGAPFPNLERDGHPITLRTLATHTAGMPRDIPDTDALFADPDVETLPDRMLAPERGFTRRDYLKALHETSLRAAPGGREQYSNAGVQVIALGLEQVYAQRYPRLLQREILGPLHMGATGFSPPPRQSPRTVTGYGRSGAPAPLHAATAGAAWGLYSTPQDMAKYAAWHLNEADPVVMRAHALISGDAGDGRGLLWNEALADGERILWHGGGSFGMTSQMVLYPEAKEGYVLLANDACAQTESDLKTIATTLHAARKRRD